MTSLSAKERTLSRISRSSSVSNGSPPSLRPSNSSISLRRPCRSAILEIGGLSEEGRGTMTHRIRRVAVLGAGTMGAAIAAHCANAGLEVDLLDIAPDEPDAGKNDVVEAGFDRMKNARPAALMSGRVAERIRLGNFDDDFDRVAEADWVLEAILEKLEPKQELMQRVENVARDDALISSNTSGIPLHQVAEGRSQGFRRR